ncbi:amyloid-beta-like protein [Trifolium pratense]|uniref:amyloid-beta-like protein n=1 Tax=Trifolium pratense TaxID=57577 RepID=UPI001E696F01|nr:amyloid-beta-like protein [Trifolium pratense]
MMMMNKGREGKTAAPSTDLLVCFPSRTHLRLMPKPICSPVRPSEPNKRHHHNSQHQRKRSISRTGGGISGGGQAGSPMLWTKNKSNMGSGNSEPTSPKVTCAGQIKVKHKNSACRNWQSVMEEIEKIHNDKKQKKRFNWAESLGFKKEIMQFFTCLRAVRFDLRCFGSFSGTDIVTEDEEEEDDDDGEDEVYYENDHVNVEENHDENESSRTVFSKWYMVLQEEHNTEAHIEEQKKEQNSDGEIAVPPPNALLLMRCRSAPAKSWLEESEEEGGNNNEKEKNSQKEKEIAQTHVKKGQSLKSLMEEEERNNKENLVVMRYNSDYYGISTDIATETWIVGGLTDPLARSRSWKR